MRKMPKVDMYDPVIYPRKLWITKDVEGLDRIFIFCKNNGREEAVNGYSNIVDETNSTGVLLTAPVIKKSTNEMGTIVIILKPELLEPGDEAHEAVHVADYIFEQLGMYAQDFSAMNEQYAYLVGWAAGCISKTLVNIKREYDTRRESDDVEA